MPDPTTTVYLALGSNVGDSRRHIETAVRLLGESLQDIRRAPLYRSKAVGYTDQADFLNTAVVGRTALSPQALLELVKRVEKRTGRVQRFRWGPREIDVDIVLYGDVTQQTDALTLPHPAFRERDFVLRPLRDLDPDLKDPVSGRTVSQLLEQIPPAGRSILAEVD
jgi:2-amino-4-hydroxy-6-hydroxymethyldihydropteridine diphosphokinase